MAEDYKPNQRVIDYLQGIIDRGENEFLSASFRALSPRQILKEVRLATSLGRSLEAGLRRTLVLVQPGE